MEGKKKAPFPGAFSKNSKNLQYIPIGFVLSDLS